VTDDWGDELPVAPATSEPVDPDECRACGRLPLHKDTRAAALLLSRIRADAHDRLSRTEQALSGLTEIERVAMARWLQGVLDRPPLSNNRAFDYLREVIDALWRDIFYTTPDALSSTVDYGGEPWFVPLPHHELVEMREGEFVEP
jgi:hypothetical protein